MKKLFIILFLLTPITITAAPQNLRMGWDAYPAQYVGALLHGECKKLTDIIYLQVFTGVSMVNVYNDIIVDGIEGDTIQCRMWASLTGVQDSVRSEVAEYFVPFTVIPAPTGISLAVQP